MVRPQEFLSIEDLFEPARRTTGAARLLLALDGVEDPQNLGALLRVADGAGVDGVVLTERRSAPLSPVAVKASAGAAEHLRIARVVNLVRALEELKRQNLWIIGLDERGTADYDQFDFTGDCVLVLGREGAGLHDLVRKTCDHLLRIPMAAASARSTSLRRARWCSMRLPPAPTARGQCGSAHGAAAASKPKEAERPGFMKFSLAANRGMVGARARNLQLRANHNVHAAGAAAIPRAAIPDTERTGRQGHFFPLDRCERKYGPEWRRGPRRPARWPKQPTAEDAERQAITFTDFDMDVRLRPAEQHIAVRALHHGPQRWQGSAQPTSRCKFRPR